MRVIIALAAAVAMSGVAAANPIYNFFDYQDREIPVGGDCSAIAAQIGPEATWYGEFAGNKVDDYSDKGSAFSARGCFKSEIACQHWQNIAITYLERGTIVAMSCREGARRW